MKKIIELLKRRGVSLPIIDYTGIVYRKHLGFRVFQIYRNEDSENYNDKVTLWVSKHFWNAEECSINDYVTEVESDAYLNDFRSIADALSFVECGVPSKTNEIIWKNSEQELDDNFSNYKDGKIYVAPYNKELFFSKLEEILDEKTFRLLSSNDLEKVLNEMCANEKPFDSVLFKPLEESQIVLEDEMILDCDLETSKPKLVEYYLELFEGIEKRYNREVKPDESVNGYVLIDVKNQKGIKIYFTMYGDETYDDDFKVFLSDEEKNLIYQKALKKFKEDEED